MKAMNFQLAHKQIAMHPGVPSRHARSGADKPAHRPSIALILLATTVQIIAMAAVLGSASGVIN
jgi:hypothetical protein